VNFVFGIFLLVTDERIPPPFFFFVSIPYSDFFCPWCGYFFFVLVMYVSTLCHPGYLPKFVSYHVEC